MVKEIQPGVSINPRDWNMYLLEKITEVTNEQKETFLRKVLPTFQEKFKKLPEDIKTTLVVLDGLTDEEITDLSSLKEKFFLGIHKIKNNLSLLNLYTGRRNPKT